MGPVLKRLSSSGRTWSAADVDWDGVPFGMPAGMEKPTTDDVGRRDLDDEAVASDCSRDAQDFFTGGTAGLACAGGVDTVVAGSCETD